MKFMNFTEFLKFVKIQKTDF